jgi:transposase
MRGRENEQPELFHVFNVEERIRADHPLRDVKRRVDSILKSMSPLFAQAYSRTGRPSVPPERLLKAMLFMAMYSVRSERQLCDRMQTDLLFRWFLDMQPSEEAFDHAVFAHNRARLDEHDLTRKFFDAVVSEALTADLCSEHFSVDGTMIESLASAKSFQPKPKPTVADKDGPSDSAGTNAASDGQGFKPRNVEVDFHGQKRTNETHQSRTDPEAKLHRKGPGKEAKLSHMGHALTENRHGLIVGITITEANGTAEREAALDMVDELKSTHERQPKTLGTDKGYDSGDFMQALEERGIEPHVPLVKDPCDLESVVHTKRQPGVQARHRMKERQATVGYQLSQKCRKKVEEVFGWLKEIGDLGRSRVVGRWKIRQLWEIGAAAYNLIRLRKLNPMPQ